MKLDVYRFSVSTSALLAILTGLFCGSVQAENAVSPYATGGDRVYTIDMGGGVTDYVHVFSNKADAATFANTSGKALPVRYLAVGGGGAGGTGLRTDYNYCGAGGGGGGGVAEAFTVIGVSDEWTIFVGKGGVAASAYNEADVDGTDTAISNGVNEVVCVPFGGNGGHYQKESYPAKAGAAGGGGSTKMSKTANGASGTFASYTLACREAMHAGGSQTSKYYTNETANSGYRYLLPGGGGGAGGDGGTAPTNKDHPGERWTSGEGGAGLASDITGETRYYGAGGGAGGMHSAVLLEYVECNFISGGEGGSGVGGTGGTFTIKDSAAKEVRATAGLDGTGSGGGGGYSVTTALSLKKYNGGNGGDGIVVVRYTAWNSAADTPAFESLGAAGEVTYYVAGEVEKEGDKVWLKPGATATLYAVDAGGNLLTGWEDSETGEFIRGTGNVQVTPATRRNYTAVFGKPWTYDSTAKTLSNGDWTFKVITSKSKEYVYDGKQVSGEDGFLNFATPMYDTSGNVYRPDGLGRGGDSAGQQFVSNAVCKTIRLFLPEDVDIIKYLARSDKSNATIRCSISIPRGITVDATSFYGNNCLTNVYFEGGEDGGQSLPGATTYGLFCYCSALANLGPMPRTRTAIGNSDFQGCSSLESLYLPFVTNVGYNSFYSCSSLTNIVFSTNAVVFVNAYAKGGTFAGVPRGARIEFPGKAPIIDCLGTAVVDSVEYPYAGNLDTKLFGSSDGRRFYGSWRNDPEGWQKLIDEIGSSDYTGLTPPELEPGDRSVKGIFYWANKNNTTKPFYGWLIDTKMPGEPPRPGMMLYLK